MRSVSKKRGLGAEGNVSKDSNSDVSMPGPESLMKDVTGPGSVESVNVSGYQ